MSVERARDCNEGAIRFGRDQQRKRIGRLCGKALRRQAGAGARRRERIEIFRIVEKANVGRPRAIKRRNIADAPVERRIRSRLGAGEPDDLLDRQLAVGWEEMRHSACAVDLKLCPCDSEIRLTTYRKPLRTSESGH